MFRPRLAALISIVMAAALSRLIPHPPNMTSVAAVALFGGAYFSDRRLAFLVPLAALFLSDLLRVGRDQRRTEGIATAQPTFRMLRRGSSQA